METTTFKRNSLNNHVFTGNIVADGTLNEDKTRLAFKIAVEQGKSLPPMFIDCIQFTGKDRPALAIELAKKGTPVTVEGYLKDYPKDGYKNITLVVRGAYLAPRAGSTITGNVVADPRKGESNGNHYLSFRVAHNTGKDADGNDRPAFFIDVVVTAKDESRLPELKKGQNVEVKGRLAYSKTEKDGKTYENWRIYAWSVKDNPLVEYELVPVDKAEETAAAEAPIELIEDLPAADPIEF